MASTESTPHLPKLDLNDQQKIECEERGYIVVRDVLSLGEIEAYKKRARGIVLGDIPEGGERMIVRDVRVAKGRLATDDPEMGMWKLFYPDLHDELFRSFAETPRMLDVVEGLIGPDILSFVTMFIYKPPRLPEAVHNYHQDGFYFPFGPHDSVMGVWIALDATTSDNGTLRVIPGSHRKGVKAHVLPPDELVNAGILGVEGHDDDPDEVVLELEPGEAAFFHSRLLHRTLGNTTDGHRRVLTMHCAGAECRMDEGKKFRPEFRLVRGRRREGCL